MGRNLLEELQGVVKDQTTKAEGISNLHGVVVTAEVSVKEPKPQAWYVATVSARSMPSVDGAIDLYTYERSGYQTLDGDDSGTIRFPESGLLPQNQAVLFLTVARAPSSRTVPIRVTAPGSRIAVAIGRGVALSGHDEVWGELAVPQGDTPVVVLIHGGSKPVSITVAKDVELVRAEPTPPAPTIRSVVTYSIDPERGTLLNRVRWLNEASASAWQVYRADTTPCGAITGIQTLAGGIYRLTLSQPMTFVGGESLYSEAIRLGRVVGEVTTGNEVDVQADGEDAPATAAEWVDLPVYRTDEFRSVAHVTPSGQTEPSWDDNTISKDRVYVYKVTSFGIWGLAESDFSEESAVYTNDRTPPGPVTPTTTPVAEVVGKTVLVRYQAPSDPDFEGVRVYGPYALGTDNTLLAPITFVPSMQVKTEFGFPGQNDEVRFDGADTSGGYFLVSFDALGNQQLPADAWGFVYGGPAPIGGGDPEPASNNCAIDISVAPSADQQTHTITLRVYPAEATFTAWLNGTTLGPATNPAITDLGQDVSGLFHTYRVVVARSTSVDQRFVARASGTDLRPASVTYTIDRDDTPGLSGVDVQNRTSRPTVRAIMDDDANHIRLVRQDNGAVLATQNRATSVLMIYQHTTDLAPGEELEVRIEASRNGTTWIECWRGMLEGPGDGSIPVVGIQLSSVTVAEPNHTVRFVVTPNTATVHTEINGLVATPTTGTDAAAGVYVYRITRQTDVDQRLILEASAPNYVTATSFYSVDRDDEPGLAGVSIDNRKARPTIRAVMDDDASWMRLRRGTTTVLTATRTSGVDTTTVKYNSLEMTYTRPTDLAVDEEEEYTIEVSRTNSNYVARWRGRMIGPPPATPKAPIINVEAVGYSGAIRNGVSEVADFTVRATNPNGGGVRLKWQTQDENRTWASISGNLDTHGSVQSAAGQSTVSRPFSVNRYSARAGDRVFRLYAETTSGDLVTAEHIYVVDWDNEPEVVSAVAAPFISGGRQTGWTIAASVDDDTDLVVVTAENLPGGTHEITGLPANIQTAGVDGSGNPRSKTFTFNVTQGPGGAGRLVLTPRRSGVSGVPVRVTLTRTPVTTIRIEETSGTKIRAILASNPPNAAKFIRGYVSGTTPVPSFSSYTEPVTYHRHSTEDFVIEYYSSVNGLVEDTKQTVIDPDNIAELENLADNKPWTVEKSGNVIYVKVHPDSDVVTWKCWAKKNSDPGNLDDYLKFEGAPDTSSVSFYATPNNDGTAATWYIRVAAYNWAGEINNTYPAKTIQITVPTGGGGGGSDPPPLGNPAILSATATSDYDRHKIEWITNAAGGGMPVDIVWFNETRGTTGLIEATTGATNTDGKARGIAYHPVTFDPYNGRWETYVYDIKFRGQYPGSLSTSVSDYYQV